MQSGGTGSGFATSFAVGTAPIPEPGTAGLLLVGLALLAARRRSTNAA